MTFSLDQLLATIADIAPNRFLQALMIIVVTALAVYFVFLAWQIDVTAWMASAGILGLAVSFAVHGGRDRNPLPPKGCPSLPGPFCGAPMSPTPLQRPQPPPAASAGRPNR